MTEQKRNEIIERVLAKLNPQQKKVIMDSIVTSGKAYKIGAIEKSMYNDGVATGYVRCLQHLGVISIEDAFDMYTVINEMP